MAIAWEFLTSAEKQARRSAARRAALDILIAAHRAEYDLLFAQEKEKRGIPLSVQDVSVEEYIEILKSRGKS